MLILEAAAHARDFLEEKENKEKKQQKKQNK